MRRKKAALILLAASSILSGCGDKAVSAPAPAPTETAAETETETEEEVENGSSQVNNSEEKEEGEMERIIRTGERIDEADIFETLNPAEGVIKNKAGHEYAYSYLDTFIASLQTYAYFTGADENQTADIADYYAEDWKDMTAEELDAALKELSGQTGTGVMSSLGLDLLEALEFGDAMADKILDGIEEDLEAGQEEEAEKTGTTGTTGTTDSSGNGNTGNTGNTGNAGNTDNTDNSLPPADNDYVGNPDAGYMTDEEFDALDWSSDPYTNTDSGDNTIVDVPDIDGTIIAY